MDTRPVPSRRSWWLFLHGIALGLMFNLSLLPMLEAPARAQSGGEQPIELFDLIQWVPQATGPHAFGDDAYPLLESLVFAGSPQPVSGGLPSAWILDEVVTIEEGDHDFIGHLMVDGMEQIDAPIFSGAMLEIEQLDDAQLDAAIAAELAGNEGFEGISINAASLVLAELHAEGTGAVVGLCLDITHPIDGNYTILLPYASADSVDTIISIGWGYLEGQMAQLPDFSAIDAQVDFVNVAQASPGTTAQAAQPQRWGRWRCWGQAATCVVIATACAAIFVAGAAVCAAACASTLITTIIGLAKCIACISGGVWAVDTCIGRVRDCVNTYKAHCP